MSREVSVVLLLWFSAFRTHKRLLLLLLEIPLTDQLNFGLDAQSRLSIDVML